MSEKRFRKENGLIFDEQEECINASVDNVIDLLNTLHQENEILETDCKNQKESKEYWRNKAKELEEENEQLKYDNEALKGVFESYRSISEHTQKELREENEQLKIRLLNCEQKKNDNGGFQVWEMPPIPQGKRISFTTNNGDV